MQQIIINNIHRPKEKDLQKDVEWVCNSFGFSSRRDTSRSAIRILFDLLGKFADNTPIRSESVAESLGLTTGIVNHHVRNLAESGLLFREKKMIVLRGGSLKSAVEEMRKDTNRVFDQIKIIAEEIDETLGIKNRW